MKAGARAASPFPGAGINLNSLSVPPPYPDYRDRLLQGED
jgi:hypothetical protein